MQKRALFRVHSTTDTPFSASRFEKYPGHFQSEYAAALKQGRKALNALPVAFFQKGFRQCPGGIEHGGVHARVLGGSFQRGQLGILHVGQQQCRIRCQGHGVFFPHRLLYLLEFPRKGGGILTALGAGGNRIGAAPQVSHGAAGIVVAQLHVPSGGIGVKVEDISQLPVTADHGGGQAGAVGQGDAHPFQINTDQFLRAHLLGQRGGHIVPVAAIQELHPVDLLCPQGAKWNNRSVLLYRQALCLWVHFDDL